MCSKIQEAVDYHHVAPPIDNKCGLFKDSAGTKGEHKGQSSLELSADFRLVLIKECS